MLFPPEGFTAVDTLNFILYVFTNLMETSTPQLDPQQPPGRSALALLLLVPAPTIGVLCAMFLFPGSAFGQSMHAAAKVWLLAFPIAWVLWVQRGRITLPRWSWRGMPAGLITGLLTLGIIIGTWELFASTMVDVSKFQTKMQEIGLDSLPKFLAFAAALTFVNALLEEYVWRWFVYEKWNEVLKGLKGPAKAVAVPGAIVLAGLCFTLHHTIAMHLYFDWQVNLIASLGVFTGGVTWSIVYLKYKNIYAGYISHIFADIAIFYIGYRVAFG